MQQIKEASEPERQTAIRVGTAGWSIHSRHAESFSGDGSHLQRYARQLNAAEINSSFYRPHKRPIYERWAASVPASFRFSVKLPREITHERRLVECAAPLERFLDECCGLGDRLGVLLVQLPPTLVFGSEAAAFFAAIRERTDLPIAVEPRHASWVEAEEMLTHHRVARVATDPTRFAGDDRPGGWDDLAYHRLHGSPVIYRSDYPDTYLATLARQLEREREAGAQVWCIFDNTTLSHALPNALKVAGLVG